MSKFVGRKSRWVEVNNLYFTGSNGYVQCNRKGLWDAVVTYKSRPALERKGERKDRPWSDVSFHCGEFKRLKEAMDSVEKKAKEMISQKNPDIIMG